MNVFDPRVFARGVPHDELRRLRDTDPVSWQDEHEVGVWPAGPGFWAVTRYADVRHVLRAPEDFSSASGATQIRDPDPVDLPFIRRMVLNMDPPDQVRMRTLVTGAFTRRRLERFTDVIAARTRTLLAAARARGRCDLPRDVTDDLPLQNLSDLLGVPAPDRPLLKEWTDRVIGYQDPEHATVVTGTDGRPVNPRSPAMLADMFGWPCPRSRPTAIRGASRRTSSTASAAFPCAGSDPSFAQFTNGVTARAKGRPTVSRSTALPCVVGRPREVRVGSTGRMIALLGLAAALAGCGQPGESGLTPDEPSVTTTPAEAPTAAPTAAPALPSLLGAGLVDYPVEIRTPGPAMYSVRTAVLPPGGTTGWHAHPGTETTIVTSGVLTVLQEGGCDPVRYDAGDAVFVADAVPHLARNDGSAPVELLTTHLLAPGAPDRFDAPPACAT